MIVKRDIAVKKMVANLVCHVDSEFYAAGKRWILYRTGRFCVLRVIAEEGCSYYRMNEFVTYDEIMFAVYSLLRERNVLKTHYCFLDDVDYAYWHDLPL